MSPWSLVSGGLRAAGLTMLLTGLVIAVDALATRLIARHVACALNEAHEWVDEP